MRNIVRQLFSTINQADRLKFNKVDDWWVASSSMSPLQSYNHLRVQFIHQTLNKQQYGESLTGLKALDVGVGGGILSESLCRLGCDVTGIDVSEKSIEIATNHKQLDPQLRDNNKLTYILSGPEGICQQFNEQFDIITAMEVIEHVANPELFIQSIANMLKPQGVLFMSTINRTWESYLKLIVGAEYISGIVPIGTHNWNQFKTPEEIWLILNINKMKITEVSYQIISSNVEYHIIY